MNNSTNPYLGAAFSEDLHGIPCMRLRTENGQAAIAAQGAQVISWCGANGRERMYLSPQTLGLGREQTADATGPAIRGGVPVCFPQFSDRGTLMKHGFARNRLWEPAAAPADACTGNSQSAAALFRFSDDDITRAQWPHRFNAELKTEIGPNSLRIALQIDNPSDAPFSFTLALHTYLRVADIRQTTLAGLQGGRFEDATKGMQIAVQNEEHLRILDEIDRVYLDAPEKIMLHESGKPSLVIAQEGFRDMVVWNPGPEKAKALPDLPDGDWLHMLCVEAACAGRPVTVQAGASWTGSQILSIPGSL